MGGARGEPGGAHTGLKTDIRILSLHCPHENRRARRGRISSLLTRVFHRRGVIHSAAFALLVAITLQKSGVVNSGGLIGSVDSAFGSRLDGRHGGLVPRKQGCGAQRLGTLEPGCGGRRAEHVRLVTGCGERTHLALAMELRGGQGDEGDEVGPSAPEVKKVGPGVCWKSARPWHTRGKAGVGLETRHESLASVGGWIDRSNPSRPWALVIYLRSV